MFLIKCILDCCPLDSTQYAAISKKDDDFGMEALNTWKASYPIRYELEKLRAKEIEEYVDNLIKGLREVPITSSNVDFVKEHLIEVSKQSDTARRRLIKKVSIIKAEDQSIRYIKNGLIFTYTDKL